MQSRTDQTPLRWAAALAFALAGCGGAPPRSRSRASPTRATSGAPASVRPPPLGAFAVEANARSLQERLSSIGHRAFIDHEELYRVRIGPFTTREQAVAARASLEANGISAMIVRE